jgi:hypothetical protein
MRLVSVTLFPGTHYERGILVFFSFSSPGESDGGEDSNPQTMDDEASAWPVKGSYQT